MKLNRRNTLSHHGVRSFAKLGLLLTATAGCASEGSGQPDDDVSSVTQAILDPDNQAFRPWSATSFTFSPTVRLAEPPTFNGNRFLGTQSVVIMYRQANSARANEFKKYYVKRATYSASSPWTVAGNKTFVSAPASTMEYPVTSFNDNLVFAGKGADSATAGMIYAVGATLPPYDPTQGVPPGSPRWSGSTWMPVGTATYTGTNGYPALASNERLAALVFRNGNRVLAHTSPIPYVHDNWTDSPIQSPLLPTGVTATGVPAIAYLKGSINKFVVVVRCSTSSGYRLRWLYFNGTQFQGPWGEFYTAAFSVDSDPAVEWDYTNNFMTVYFRSGNEVLQGSAVQPEDMGVHWWYPVSPFPGTPTASPYTTIVDAPRVAFGASQEGSRAVVVRGYDVSTPGFDRPDPGEAPAYVEGVLFAIGREGEDNEP